MFESHIKYSSMELSQRDKVRMKDTSNAIPLDDTAGTVESPLVIEYKAHVVLEVHNDKADNPDYEKILVIGPNGDKYITGSTSFLRALEEIVSELKDDPDPIYINVYKRPSKNYSGKNFITCSLA